MSTSFGSQLPLKIVEMFTYKNNKRENSAVFLITVDHDETPHVALLSPYQVVVVDESKLLIAVQRGTRSQMYLHENLKGTLILQLEPAVDYVKFYASVAPNWGEYENEILYSCAIKDISEDFSNKAPFISELKFDQREIYKDYMAGFENIRKYVLSS
jgi:hypothetical protein